MKRYQKIILLSVGILVAGFAGLSWYVSGKIQPDQIRSEIQAWVNTTYPNVELKIGEVDYNLGPKVRLLMKDSVLQLRPGKHKFSESNIASLKYVRASIPIWSILTSGGRIQIDVVSPEVTMEGENWKYALKTPRKKGRAALPEPQSKKTQTSGPKSDTFVASKGFLAGFIAKGQVDVKISSVLVKLLSKESTEIQLDRIVLKGLEIGKKAAYEIDAKLQQGKSVLSAHVSILGQFNTPKFVQGNGVELAGQIKLRDVTGSKVPLQLPQIKGSYTVQVDKKSNLIAELKTVLEGIGGLDLVAKSSARGIQIKSLSADLGIEALLGSVKRELLTSVPKMKAPKTRLKLQASGDIRPNRAPRIGLTWELSDPMEVATEWSTIELGGKGSLKKGQLKNELLIAAFGGNVEVLHKAPLNLKKTALGKSNIRIRGKGLVIPAKRIQSMLAVKGQSGVSGQGSGDPAAKEAGAGSNDKNEGPSATPTPVLPAVEMNLALDDISIEQSKMNTSMVVKTSGRKVLVQNLTFTQVKGGSVKGQMTKGPEGLASTLNFKNFQFAPFRPLLPSTYPSFTGRMSGRSVVQLMQGGGHKAKLEFTVRDGNLKNVNLRQYADQLLKKIPLLKSLASNKTPVKMSERFKKMTVDLSATTKGAKIKKVSYVSDKNGLNVNFFGSIDLNGASSIQGQLSDGRGKIRKLLGKASTLKTVPFRMSGKGVDLAPDIGFTTSKLKRALAKKQASKVARKLKDKVKEKLPEKLRNNQQVNDLLDKVPGKLRGLFE